MTESGTRPANADEEGLFGQVADEFFARARRGEDPSIEECGGPANLERLSTRLID